MLFSNSGPWSCRLNDQKSQNLNLYQIDVVDVGELKVKTAGRKEATKFSAYIAYARTGLVKS